MSLAPHSPASEVLPAYEPDDGELTPEQLDAIRQAEPQGRVRSFSFD